MFNALTIGQRILLLACSLLLAMFVLGGGTWWTMNNLEAELKVLVNEKIAFRHQLDRMQRTMMQIRQDEKNIFISIGNPANTDQSIQTNKQALDKSIAKLRDQVGEAKAMAMAGDHQAEFDGVLSGLDGYAQGMAGLYQKIEKGEIAAANVADANIIPFKPKLYAARDTLIKLRELADNTAKESEDAMVAAMERAAAFLLTLLLAVLLGGAALAWVITRSINKPLDSMQERMRFAAEH